MSEEWKEGTEQPQQDLAAQTANAPSETSPAPDAALVSQLAELEKRVAAGGSWFYWIAGLSIINTMITVFHGSIAFMLGLGITQFLDAAITEFGPKAAIIVLPMNLAIIGIYVVFGIFACRRMNWAFIVGMILYTLDACLCLLVQEWFGLAIHGYALYCIYNGFKANKEAARLKQTA